MRIHQSVIFAASAGLLLALVHYAHAQEGKEYVPVNKRFKIMMPPGNKSGQRTQIITINKTKVPIEAAYSAINNGPAFSVASVGIPARVMATIPASNRFDTVRDAILKGMGGKAVDEKELKQGDLTGKDYQIEGKTLARMQMYMQGGFVFFAIVESKNKDDITAKLANDFFASFKMTPDIAEGKTEGGSAGQGGATKILGGGNDPEFKDEAPDGTLLVGFEFGLGKFVNQDVIKAVRPIYRDAKGGEALGKAYGKNHMRGVTVTAKSGYAVGAVAVNAGLGVDGLSITFMKVKDGRLDPQDAYASEYIGGKGGSRTILNGTGLPVVGIVGRSNANDCTGIGLLLKK
jgi:hypothetical protein